MISFCRLCVTIDNMHLDHDLIHRAQRLGGSANFNNHERNRLLGNYNRSIDKFGTTEIWHGKIINWSDLHQENENALRRFVLKAEEMGLIKHE